MTKTINEPAAGRAVQPRRSTRRRRPDQPCLNCGDTTHGDYCPNCGQPKREVAVSVRTMIADVLEDQLVLSRALPRTLASIFFRPGFLTAEYISGRIVRYIAPFRLYLVASVIFFLLLSVIGLNELQINADFTGNDADPELEAALSTLRDAADAADAETGAGAAAAAETRRLIAAAADSIANAIPAAAPPQNDGLQPWARNLQIDMGSDELSSRVLQRTVQRFGHLPPGEASREFAKEYLQYVPHTMFVLMPIFAFLLKLLYVRRRRYYAEHFVFALHFHAFVFLIFILMLLIQRGIATAILAGWIAIYLWLGMKRVYRQGFFRTSVKYFMLCTSYTIVMIVGLAGTLFVTLTLL